MFLIVMILILSKKKICS